MTTIKYKVIAEYPGMLLKIGDVITTYESSMAYVTYDIKTNLADYPHLFQEVKEETE